MKLKIAMKKLKTVVAVILVSPFIVIGSPLLAAIGFFLLVSWAFEHLFGPTEAKRY